MNTILFALLTLPAWTHARLPTAGETRELKSLRGSYYGALSTAITNFNEIPPEDRAKSPAADRALTQIRHALKKLERAPGVLPINSGMTDEQMAKALRGVRVADAFCNLPVVSFYIIHPEGGLKIQPHYSYSDAPTLEEVRQQNPGCDVQPVYFSSNPGAAR